MDRAGLDEGQQQLRPGLAAVAVLRRSTAQYFAKYIQGYAGAGRPRGLRDAAERADLLRRLPVDAVEHLRAAVLHQERPATRRCTAPDCPPRCSSHDWNWDAYNTWAAPLLADTAIRNDPNFGGIAWHGYGGNVSTQTTVHNQYPARERVRHRALRRHLDRQPAAGGHAQPHRLHPQLGPQLGQVEPRRRPEHGPAQRRLRYLHRPDHRPQWRQPQRAGRLHRRVLHDGPPDQVREAGRGAHRLDAPTARCRTWPGRTRTARRRSSRTTTRRARSR